MEYLNYVYETFEDIYYYYFENKYEIPWQFSLNRNYENEIEINKVLKEVENEIKMDREIKELEKRYNNLCEFMKEEYNQNGDDNENNNNNKSNNDGALKLKVKKVSLKVS